MPQYDTGEQSSDKTRGDFSGGVQVGVVDPRQAVGVAVRGGKLWPDLPAVENPMRMHGVAPGCKVLQADHDNFVNLGSQYRPQEAEPGRSGGQAAVRGIRVLSEHGLLVNTADTLGSSFQKRGCKPETEVETEKWVNMKECCVREAKEKETHM
ncbi:hypothetical protein EYF80_058037 [Liparis tanakae]|uniref:Uncharacterized protein n=1 Tax=Liparis tanakae TaxID=230148 RepID=A0A4Z2ESB0_9TELE|nr:hypothetical protein EYF80_058037 [Liparis tanakae]